MILEDVVFLSPRRAKVTITKDDYFETFISDKKGNRRIFFEKVPHILFKEDGKWKMIEEELYEV